MNLHDDVYAYALSALPPEEAAQFEEHLAECERCRTELTSLDTVAAELSSLVATPPPPQLRSAVLEAIGSVPQGLRRTDSVAVQIPEPSEEPPAAAADASVVAFPSPAPAARQSWFPAILAAAAVIVALAVGGWAWQQRQAAEQAAQQATARTAALTRLLGAPDVKMVAGKVANSGAPGRVVMSVSQHRAMFVAASLPKLPAGKVYEAWTIRGKPVPAGTFSAAEAKTLVALPQRALSAKTVAVTIEPAGGSKTPTSSPIFAVNLPHPA